MGRGFEQPGQQQIRRGEVAVGQSAFLHRSKQERQAAREGQALRRGKDLSAENNIQPCRPADPGHHDGIAQVSVLANEVGVADGGEYGARTDLKPSDSGVGGDLLGLGHEGGSAKARLKELEGRRSPVVGEQLKDDTLPSLLAVGHPRGGRMFGDPVDRFIDCQFVARCWAEWHRSGCCFNSSELRVHA